MKLKVTVNGSVYDVDVEVEPPPAPQLGAIYIGGGPGSPAAAPTTAKAPAIPANALTASIAGTVVKVLVEEGQEVKGGETLLVLEAMKMETEVTAPRDGRIAAVAVAVGDAVQPGEVLIDWEPEE